MHTVSVPLRLPARQAAADARLPGRAAGARRLPALTIAGCASLWGRVEGLVRGKLIFEASLTPTKKSHAVYFIFSVEFPQSRNARSNTEKPVAEDEDVQAERIRTSHRLNTSIEGGGDATAEWVVECSAAQE